MSANLAPTPVEISPQEWFATQVKSLLSHDGAVLEASIARWRTQAGSLAFDAVADKLLSIVRRGGPRADRAAATLIALGGPVLFRIPGHIARARKPAARLRLLDLMARAEPVDGMRGQELETELLALVHRERDRAVQEAYAPVLLRHARFALWIRGLLPDGTACPGSVIPGPSGH